MLKFLLAQHYATDDVATIDAGIESVRDLLARHYVHRGEAELIKSTIRDRGRHRIVDMAQVILDDRKTPTPQPSRTSDSRECRSMTPLSSNTPDWLCASLGQPDDLTRGTRQHNT